MDNGHALSDYLISSDCEIQLTVPMRVFVRFMSGRNIEFDMDGLTKVRQAKSVVKEKEGILCRQQHLHFAGRLLDDSWSSLCENDIHDGATLDLVVGSVGPADIVSPAGGSEPHLFAAGHLERFGMTQSGAGFALIA